MFHRITHFRVVPTFVRRQTVSRSPLLHAPANSSDRHGIGNHQTSYNCAVGSCSCTSGRRQRSEIFDSDDRDTRRARCACRQYRRRGRQQELPSSNECSSGCRGNGRRPPAAQALLYREDRRRRQKCTGVDERRFVPTVRVPRS